ncbi:nucleoside/nucleotide kinase family protein [Protaetiibacter larvae]|uniref:Nucleoside/nucleotide kinase family protein n=1 Tax=Protaetiibacter larvae TaxID=2592654 RepID=A0A5C1YDB6_9MICO|nr:nucleoside/nucleotide kinase family protein [Protaetiibacter larvae]
MSPLVQYVTSHAAADAGRRLLVGIAGAPGSGKSTAAAQLVAALGPSASVLPMDGFHLPQARLVALGRRERMGAPDTFDVDGFIATLGALRDSAGTVEAPGFDRGVEEPIPGAIRIGPEIRIVVVEGNYLLHDAGGWERVRPLLELTVLLEIDDALRRRRLVERHLAFGKDPAAAAAWVRSVDEPNALLVARGRGRADRVLRVD